MTVIGLSLNTNEKVHPVIWSVRQLPFDAIQFVPVPKPLGNVLFTYNTSFINVGGVLVFGANSLVYLNQVLN